MSDEAAGDGASSNIAPRVADQVELRALRELRIVCAYPDGMLANPWFRSYKRIKRAMRRSSFAVHVELLPISAISPISHAGAAGDGPRDSARDGRRAIHILAVPPSLAEAAGTTPTADELIVAAAADLQAAIDQAVARLSADGRLLRDRPPSRATAVHLGFQAVRERARLTDG